ncbi:hypothetical protein SLEP1_g12449 [Rubroshorea leprosula]|uniref:Uncharacterized protein n=1 Tax=Rubroshorea leprosula TaxID=152421 RepID=A0AAV5IH19_9ROSI|nr:hypothetical protein SLEP1_g12449 [Rubroshorea leprosula]
MGTKVQCQSYLPGYYSMGDLNEDSNSLSWSLYYGDKTLANGEYYNVVSSRAIADACPGYGKDVLKQTMLKHEAIFKDQVSELHRLYRIQRDMMDDIKKKELQKSHISAQTSLSSSPLASQITFEDTCKWHVRSFPLANSFCARPSISGYEDIHSPLSFMKGNSVQTGSFLSQNGGSLKDVEVLDCRPTKVRRKMFDLQLPADEYIDTEEAEHRDATDSGMASHLSNGNGKVVSENGPKLFLGDCGKKSSQVNSLTSKSCLRATNGLADLNEPAVVEDTNGSVYADLLGNSSSLGKIQGYELAANPDLQLLGFPNEISMNSHHRSNKRSINDLCLENKGHARGLFSHVPEAGHGKSPLISASQAFHSEKLHVSCQPGQVLFDKVHDPPTLFPTDQSKVDLLRRRTVHDLEISGRNHESSGMNQLSVVTSNIPSPNPFVSADLMKSWPNSFSSWENPGSTLSQKSVLVQEHPFLNSAGTSSKSSTISTQSNGGFGDKWQLNSSSRHNPGFIHELPNQKDIYYGSSSGSKELAVRFPSASNIHLNSGNGNSLVPDHFTAHVSTKLSNSSNSTNMKVANDVNLNVALSCSSSNRPALQCVEIDGGRKNEHPLPGLPCLRATPACKNEATIAGRDLNMVDLNFSESPVDQSANKNESANCFSQMLNENVKSVTDSNNVEASRTKISDCLSNKKILGIPIFGMPPVSKESSSLTSLPSLSISEPSERKAGNNGRNRFLDINLPCDDTVPESSQGIAAEVVVVEKEADIKVASSRQHIDLNTCVTEDDASFIPSVSDSNVKMTGGIDLEASLVTETEAAIHGEEFLEKACETSIQSSQHTDKCPLDEVIRTAAETMVAISSSVGCHLNDSNCNSSETSITDLLHWFVEVVSSFGEDIENRLDNLLTGRDGGEVDDSSSEEIDYFESMTLQLAEIQEEEYMPKSLVPENLKVEETGTSLLTSQSRKGQGRRGRQRRDFQRDILPGLASLSRHEVTEDLQTFGGLMRATGHLWHSGLTRRSSTRSGSGRGRRRSITSSPPALTAGTAYTLPTLQPVNNIEVALEDRSLTGWGKTPRRPRRQRCPVSNPPSIPLT